MNYEIGDIVNIYEKPLSEEDFEGKAKLIKPIAEIPGGERWLVEFEGEIGNYYERTVKVA